MPAPMDNKGKYIPRQLIPTRRIYDNVAECIGNTPLVRLHAFPRLHGLKCDLLVKCEYFNAGGSVKDRIAKRMVEQAERQGLIHPGQSTLIEPTSGNTGIGLALMGALKGYRVVITLPEKMSQEKVATMSALGAQIIRTPTEAVFDAPESHMQVAKRLSEEIPHAVILDQYGNAGNPGAHYHGTGEEILRDGQSDGKKIDAIVMGAGTGGTVSGIAMRCKEQTNPPLIIGVDPKGSLLSGNKHASKKMYHVEGIGYDFIPNVLDLSLVDEWERTEDKESFETARQLIRTEGLLCGGSSGAAMAGAIKAINRDARVVVVLPDSIRNYMSKFMDDDWMLAHKFTTMEDNNDTNLIELPLKSVKAVSVPGTIKDMLLLDNDLIPVVSAGNKPTGVINVNSVLKKLALKELNVNDQLTRVIGTDFIVLPSARCSLTRAARLLGTGRFVFVLGGEEGAVMTVDKGGLLHLFANQQ